MSDAAIHAEGFDAPNAAAHGQRHRVGMICFLCTEAAFFSTLIVAYLTYLNQSTVGPTPAEALRLELALINTFCLVASSATIAWASAMLARGRGGAFLVGLLATIALGTAFLVVTGLEWRELIFGHGLTIGRNLFGTTYFTLIGFHGAHVTLGLLVMVVVAVAALAGRVHTAHHEPFEMLSWYWHFVDTVWIAILVIVYLAGR